MDTSNESLIDDLAARTKICDYGDFEYVIATQPQSCMASLTLALGAQFSHNPKLLDAFGIRADGSPSKSTVSAKKHQDDPEELRCITPPPLEGEEAIEEFRQEEAEARKLLEDDGCPACYPPDLDIPLQNLPSEFGANLPTDFGAKNLPSEFEAIVAHWQSRAGTLDAILCSQAADWRSFRLGQRWARANYRNKPFSRFIGPVCERRRKYNLCGDVRLLMDPTQQSQLENWMEYQDYHLVRFEKFEKEQDKTKQQLNSARKLVNDTNTARDITTFERRLDFGERNLEQQKVLLRWIEQQRQAMIVEHPQPPLQEDNDNQVPRSEVLSARDDPMRESETSTVSSQVRVTRARSRKRDTRIQKLELSEFGQPNQDSIAVPHTTTHQEPPPRSSMEEGRHLRRICPLRVPKASCFGDVGFKALARTQNRGSTQIQPPKRARSTHCSTAQRPRPAFKIKMTRSGRISKPPLRWAP
ncbi:hypothetical protein MMC07_003240 [Pseudocyphellaria aurata]|nr:hypothetical protein [Pseudocyphellaria aurata]